MNHFSGLPWRIASLAGLLVGGVSLLTGAGAWTCLLRVAIAFAVFGAAGFGLKLVLQAEPPAVQRKNPAQRKHSDQTPPEESRDEPASRPGDTH